MLEHQNVSDFGTPRRESADQVTLEIDGQRCPARLVGSVAGGPWKPWGCASRAPASTPRTGRSSTSTGSA